MGVRRGRLRSGSPLIRDEAGPRTTQTVRDVPNDRAGFATTLSLALERVAQAAPPYDCRHPPAAPHHSRTASISRSSNAASAWLRPDQLPSQSVPATCGNCVPSAEAASRPSIQSSARPAARSATMRR